LPSVSCNGYALLRASGAPATGRTRSSMGLRPVCGLSDADGAAQTPPRNGAVSPPGTFRICHLSSFHRGRGRVFLAGRRGEPPFRVSEGACTTSSRRRAGLHRAALHHAGVHCVGLHRVGIHRAVRTPLASSASRLLRHDACISYSPQVKSGVCSQL
jgi:hypothetical protein